MPEIAIKQTLNDASFRRGLAENGANIRNWGREAQKAFTDVMPPAERYSAEVARLEKVHREGYLAADAYQRKLKEVQAAYFAQKNPAGQAESIVDVRAYGQEAMRVYEQTRTPMERLSQEMARLTKLHREGYLAADAYGRRVAEIQNEVNRLGIARSDSRLSAMLADTYQFRGGARDWRAAPGGGAVGAGAGLGFLGVAGAAGLGAGVAGLAAQKLAQVKQEAMATATAFGAPQDLVDIFSAGDPISGAMKFAQALAKAGEEARRLALEAQKLDLSIDGFERLSELADDSGTTIQAVGRTIERMAANLGEALQDPTTKAAQSIADMGLNVERLAGMAPEDAFEVIGTAIGSMENKFQRARAEMAIFGKSAQELDLLLRNLAKGGLKEAADTAVSAMDRAVLAQFGDHIDHAKDKWNQWWTGIKADVARAFMGEKDWQQIYARVQAPTGMSAADAQAERARRVQAELDKLTQKADGARAAFLKLNPTAEQLAQWDALNAKVKDSGKAGETAAAAIQRMADNVARMRAELAGLPAPNTALAQFDATRRYSPADVARLEQELASARIVAPMAQFQGPKQAEANRLQIYELERQLAEAKQEAAQRAKLEQLPGEEAAMQAQLAAQRQADSAVASWEQRLRAATTSADEIAAALIAGSQKFAGNLEAARAFVAEVKAAEKSQAVAKSAEQFEKSMQAEFRAREGETSRQAQLRQLVEGGLSQEAALGLAPMIAQLDAQDKLRARADQLAPNLAYGSREAYDVIARAQAAARAPDRETRLQEESARLLREIKDWLAKIHAKKTPVAEGA